MKWLGRRESENVEDRRGMTGGKKTIFGGVAGLIIMALIYFLGGENKGQLMDQFNNLQNQSSQEKAQSANPEEDKMAKYISVALADNEDVWNKLFTESKLTYIEPKLVLFRESTSSGCGGASSSMGPFYCPADQKVYIDLGFFEELKTRFGAKGGDFAISYVLAHEIGHHVQHLLGTSDKVHTLQQSVSEKKANKYSVAMELQADFYAGIWTHFNQKYKDVLEEGDIEEAMSAASAVGDDMIQKKMQGTVVPDAFTHGTSEQRKYWFKKGFESGNPDEGDTFKSLGLEIN